MTEHDFSDFPAEFRGAVLRPGDPGYTEARTIFNCRTSAATPALIARCADVDDIVTAVRYASDRDLPFGVRGGGHAIDGEAMPDGAMVIDLSGFKEIVIDPDARTVRLGPGVLLGEMDAATQEHGLVVPAGTVSTTGVAGLILGGGMGYNSRRFGMTVDNLIACDAVTVEGEKIRVSEDENPELFWGLKGAGHNLAVVTSFEVKAFPLGPEVAGGVVVFPLEETAAIFEKLDDYFGAAPRELNLDPVVLPCPPYPGMTPEYLGKNVLSFVTTYTGDMTRWEKVIAEVSGLGHPIATLVAPMPWTACNSILDVLAPSGRRSYNLGGYLARVDAALAEACLRRFDEAPAPDGPGTSVALAIQALGGAVDERDEDSTAFSREGALWLFEVLTQWDQADRDGEFEGWAERVYADLKPYVLSNGYVNLSADQGSEWVRDLYGSPEKFRRIQRLKAEWDPRNLLRFNKNIEPAGTPVAC